jgi:CheY-like chemotaxis protein
MSEAFQKTLFDPFTREEKSGTNKVQGTGLGMAITRSIVDLMGGSISVESAPGRGTRFEVVLEFPIDTESDHAQKVQALPEEAEETSPLSGMKFLCAEDNAINAEILELLLESKGASCTICSNGQEIVDAFASVKPGEYDMILMDVQMPVMDGLEATRRIRSGENPLGRIIPIRAMTANAFLEDMQKSKEAGMDEHLSKPVDIAALEQTVKRFRVTSPIKK